MNRIRAFAPEDIPEVAHLWLKVFRHTDQTPPESVTSYFQQVFFDHPWPASIPSLVSLSRNGRIIGFIGVLPRPMTFGGAPLRAAVSTQLMVDPESREPLAAIQLTKALIAGPQDLTYTDGSNEISARLWERAGGEVVPLKSLEWMRILRPTRFFSDVLKDRTGWKLLASIAKPLLRATDAGLKRLSLGSSRLPPSTLTSEPATAKTILDCLDAFTAENSLRPIYDEKSIAWLLPMAARKTKAGNLQTTVLRDASGNLAGWYLYYLMPRGTSQVLQIGARKNQVGNVIDHLFQHAWAGGSLAVRGQLEPRMMLEMSDRFGRFRCFSRGVLLHTENTDVRLAVHRGDAFLSRLEGEWWLQFDQR